MAEAASSPSGIYDRRLASRQRSVEVWRRREMTVSVSRLVVAVVGLVLAWLSLQSRLLPFGWVLLPVLLFIALLVIHERILRRLGRYQRSVTFYEQGVARLEERWIGSGEAGDRYLDPHHPYAVDLDLFGRGSVYELLCRARTRAGEDALASWLLQPASPGEVSRRQEGVRELRDRLDLREELSILGTEVRSGLDPREVESWAVAPARLRAGWLRPLLLLLAVANVLAAVGWAIWGLGPSPLLALLLVQTLGGLKLRRPVQEAVRGVDRASRDLGLLAELLSRLEAESFEALLLSDLRSELSSSGVSPGEQIHRLRKLSDLLDSRRNPFFAPFSVLLLWTPQLACAVESWRQRHGPAVRRWFEVVGEIEALASFAAHAYERPEEVFPEIVATNDALLDGSGLGHPLLPVSTCIRNDLQLGDPYRAIIVSGSNMSGKSTFLRTTGVAVVLALAGATVRARRLRLGPLMVGASIRVQDSLQEGSSRFYAEIKRLRQILDLCDGPIPVLFLLDEILHGTNSHDRRIGAEAVVRAFVDRGALGLVTTHDLALARIAEGGDERYRNAHFEDQLIDGKIHFDYHLRTGVVTHSNALALMREVGLEV